MTLLAREDQPAQLDLIDAFDGNFRWLSNYYAAPVTWDGITFSTAEAAFAAGKTLDPEQRRQIAAAASPGAAKRLGHRVQLRDQWDERHRYEVMDQVLAAKFADPGLRHKLISTGSALLIEGNSWHDQHWGECDCARHRSTPGRNALGAALMRLRGRLTGAAKDHFTRVACTGHRPQNLPAGSQPWVIDELDRVAAKLRAEYGLEIAISGGAIGADLWWADAAHRAGARVWVYKPFPQQQDRWTRDWQQHYARVCSYAGRVAVLGTHADKSLLFARNDWMIRDCDALVAVVDPWHTRGGTYAAVKSALHRKPIIHIDVRARTTRFIRPRVELILPHHRAS